MAKTTDFPDVTRTSDPDRGTAAQPAVREATDDARQAETPHTVRYMLAIGLAGVIVAFAIIYFIFV